MKVRADLHDVNIYNNNVYNCLRDLYFKAKVYFITYKRL